MAFPIYKKNNLRREDNYLQVRTNIEVGNEGGALRLSQQLNRGNLSERLTLTCFVHIALIAGTTGTKNISGFSTRHRVVLINQLVANQTNQKPPNCRRN